MLPGLPQTLTARVWQLAAVAMAAVVVLCLTTYWHLDTTQDADDGVAETLQVLRQMSRVGQNTSDAKSAHLRFVLTGRHEYLATYDMSANVAKANLSSLRLLLTSTGSRGNDFDALSRAVWESFKLADEINASLRDGRRLEAMEQIGGDRAVDLTTALQVHWEAVADVERTRLEDRREESGKARREFVVVFGLAGLLTLALLALAAASVTRSLRRPLGSLTTAIADMAAGDDEAHARVFSNDEIGRVAVAFNDMSGRALQAARNLEDSNAKLQAVSEELRARSQAIDLLGKMAHRLNVASDEVEFTDVLTKIVPQILPEMPGGLYLINNSRNLLVLSATWGMAGGMAELPEQFEQDDCWALRRGRPHVVAESRNDVVCRHIGGSGGGTGWHAYSCIPLLARGETVGLLYLMNQAGESYESDRISTVAETIALALVNHRLRASLREQSVRDTLTGLYNRRFLEEAFQMEVARAERSGLPFGVIVFDIDHFKRFNDCFGHDAGDTVLRAIGHLVPEQLREGDVTCRYGGEEFVVILPGASAESTWKRAETLRQAIGSLSVDEKGHKLGPLTVSAGVAAFGEHGISVHALLNAADAALYLAKANGRDRVEMAKAVEQPATGAAGQRSAVPTLG